MPPTRRDLLLAATATAIAATAPAGPAKLNEFDYSDVQLTGGPLKSQYDRVHAHFLSLDNDRILKVYRQRAGLPAPGEDMGGWYDANGFVPGHLIGQFISGLSRLYRNTGDPAARAKAQALVAGFAATLGPGGYPYASEKAAITWPCYILDKYEIGLIDAARLAGIGEAKELLPKVIRGAIPSIPDHTYDRDANSPKQAPYDEPYILPENLFKCWELTAEKQFLEMAKLYLLDQYFDPLSQGKNILPGKHGYSHVIALSSAAKAYLVLGNPKYLDAVRNAWEMLASTQEYASGGWAPKETFVVPGQGKLAESLATTRDHFETPCGCYAHLKAARYLLQLTGESRYGDGLERALYNTILGALDPRGDGEYFYYSDYHAGAKKGYYHRKWPCCAGTLLQTVADYPLNIYFHAPGTIFVNLYTPSEVKWRHDGVPVTLTQSTQYPEAHTMEIRIACPHPVAFTLNLRIPAWLPEPAGIAVNGKPYHGASIHRRWRNNDTVQLRLPFGNRLQPIDDRNPGIAALMRGPLMMVAINPPGAPLAFKPFHEVREEIYTTYFPAALLRQQL